MLATASSSGKAGEEFLFSLLAQLCMPPVCLMQQGGPVWGFPRIRGTRLVGPRKKDYGSLGSVLGVSLFREITIWHQQNLVGYSSIV